MCVCLHENQQRSSSLESLAFPKVAFKDSGDTNLHLPESIFNEARESTLPLTAAFVGAAATSTTLAATALVYLSQVLKRCEVVDYVCFVPKPQGGVLGDICSHYVLLQHQRHCEILTTCQPSPPHKSIQVIKFSQQHCITLHQRGRTERSTIKKTT